VENLALLEGREGEAPAASVLDFLRLRGTELRRLPGSALEARSIARLIREAGGEPELLLGSEATLARLQAAVEGKTYVHLATHGFMGSRAHPDHASLALARPEGGAGDLGFLTLEHLLGSWRGKLAGCELAVLSACDSNAGKEEGDAFLALPWGFLYAGASAVLASLWKVDDRATSLFMARFYENLLVRRMAKAAALREARLWLRRLTGRQALSSYRGLFLDETARVLEERRERAEREKDASRPSFKDETEAALAEEPYAHPFFWAGFVLVGDAS
jgi:CHAT domain-containing protein